MILFSFFENSTESSVVRVNDVFAVLPARVLEKFYLAVVTWVKTLLKYLCFLLCSLLKPENDKADSRKTPPETSGEKLSFSVYFAWGNNQKSLVMKWRSIILEKCPGKTCFSVSCISLLTFTFSFSQNANSMHWPLWPSVFPVIPIVMLRKWHLYTRLSICHVRNNIFFSPRILVSRYTGKKLGYLNHSINFYLFDP